MCLYVGGAGAALGLFGWADAARASCVVGHTLACLPMVRAYWERCTQGAVVSPQKAAFSRAGMSGTLQATTLTPK